ncbi:MAG TPA: LuxR C-terminal-related transcriptional regulator [Symbiobacteriaceae bacterium]|nr:LuxR C-terminal-related transcriptional regulator [Symbiobacteriaceae bacterium]
MNMIAGPTRQGTGVFRRIDLVRHTGPAIFLGGMTAWILGVTISNMGFARAPAQTLSFALAMSVTALPTHWVVARHRVNARIITLACLLAAGVWTILLPFVSLGLHPVVLAGMGAVTGAAVVVGLLQLRMLAMEASLGRVMGTTAFCAVAISWLIRPAMTGDAALWPLIQRVTPLLISAVALSSFREVPRSDGSPPPLSVVGRQVTVVTLVGLAGALAATLSPATQGGPVGVAACMVGFVLAGLLLDAGQETICIAMGTGAAVLSRLASPSVASAFTGLTEGLLMAFPAYVAMVHLRRESVVLLVVGLQAAVWTAWTSWPQAPVLDTPLITALLTLLSLGVAEAPRPSPERDAPAAVPAHAAAANSPAVPPLLSAGPAAQEESAPAPSATAADVLKLFYGTILTPRELQIGQFAVLGVSSRDIAAQLYLSESTVKTHLKSLYRKTEAANRNDLYRRLTAAASVETSEKRLASNHPTLQPRDGVTGLLTRQAFDLMAAERLMLEQASERPAAILFISLRQDPSTTPEQRAQSLGVVAGILQSSLRAMDLLFQYSETAFVAILPSSDDHGALLAGQRLAHRVRAWAGSRPFAPVVAVGSASTVEGLQTVGALLAEAEKRMA